MHLNIKVLSFVTVYTTLIEIAMPLALFTFNVVDVILYL